MNAYANKSNRTDTTNNSKLIRVASLSVIIVALVVVQFGLYSAQSAQQLAQTSISTPRYSGSLDGQVWIQVVGNNTAAIPILKEAHATTALYYTGANELTSENIGYWRTIWLQDQKAGLMVAYEWWFAGGWGRTMDSNYQVYQYVQAHPNQSWAEFVDTFINTSNPPAGTETLSNGTMIVPLAMGEQYYVYQWWSPADYSWLYNETHYALEGHCVSVVEWYSTSCLATESGAQYRLAYGHYVLYYNSTGLYVRLYTLRSPKIVYNLHWINFVTATTGKEYICPPGETNKCVIIQGQVQWPSLFYPGAFKVWVESWTSFAKNVSGYINYTTSDNGGFPSYDANPGLLEYIEHTYGFNFTFDNWTYSSNGGQTESQFYYHYENYLLMSRLAQIKQQIAHEYGFGVVIDGSDQNTGIYYEMGYVDGFTCWNCDEETFGSWAGNSWFSNTSAAFGFEDWFGSLPSATQVQDAATNFLSNAQLLRPEASFIAWAFQFPTVELSGTQTLTVAAKYDSMFELADGYGRYVSNIGAQRYTVGTVYVNNPQIFYQDPVWMTPSQINEVHLGSQWIRALGVSQPVNAPNYPQLSGITPSNIKNFYGWYIMYPGSPQGNNWYQTYIEVYPKLIPTYFPNTSAFWVSDVFNTYVFAYGQDYYVILDNFVGWNRSVLFAYHNLHGYLALNLGVGSVISNSTNITLPPYSSDMILLEPNQTYDPSLVYTNATVFNQVNGSLVLLNPIPATTIVTIQSNTQINSFTLNISGTGTLTLPGYNNSDVFVTHSGAEYYYTLSLPPFQQAQLSIDSGSTSQSSSSATTSQSSSSATTSQSSSSATTSQSSSSATTSQSSSSSSISSVPPTTTTIVQPRQSANSSTSVSEKTVTQNSTTSSNLRVSDLTVSSVTHTFSLVSKDFVIYRVPIAVGSLLLVIMVLIGIYALKNRENNYR
jgi:hypothetical protein